MSTDGRERVADEIAAHAAGNGPVGQRVQRRVAEDRASDRADARPGNLIARERHASQRIANGRSRAREIAAAPRGRCNRDRFGTWRVEPSALIITEDEPLVLLQRAAERAAEDVLRPLRFRRTGPVVVPRVCVEVAVAVELEDVAAHDVRSGFGDVADHRARDVARVRGVVVRLDADLGECVGTGLIRHEVVDRLVHVDAVDHVVVRLLAVSVHVRPPAAEVANVGEGSGVHADDSGQQQRQLAGVSAVQRQRDDRRARDHFADRHRLGLQKRRLAGDQDGLLDRAELQREIEPHDRLRFDFNRIGRRRLEAGQLSLQHVRPDRYRRDAVVAGFVRHGRVRHVGGLTGGGHGRAGDFRTALIADDARQRCSAGLSEGGDWKKVQGKQKREGRNHRSRSAHGSSIPWT